MPTADTEKIMQTRMKGEVIYKQQKNYRQIGCTLSEREEETKYNTRHKDSGHELDTNKKEGHRV